MPVMKVLLCALGEAAGRAARRAFGQGDVEILTASDLREALQWMAEAEPSVVIVGGGSFASVAEACRELRATDSSRDAVILAAVAGPWREARALTAAGADDCLLESDGEDAMEVRLLAARRTAACIASHRLAELDLEQLFSIPRQLTCLAGFDGYFKRVNPAWTEVLGWSTADLLANPWIDFVHPDDRANTIAAGHQLRAGQSVINFTNRYRCSDGGYRALVWCSAAQVEYGRIYGVARDLTEESSTTEAMRELTESLATTLNSIGDGVIATDLAGAIVRMNPIAELLTGWTASEATGRPLVEILTIINEDTRLPVENPIHQAIRDGEIVALARHTLLVRRDGAELPIADSCSPIRTGDGATSGAVLVFRDLTLQRTAEATRAKLQKQLVFSDRMASVGTLAAGVAHEINNPLSYVAANVEMAIDEVRAISGASASGRLRELEDMLVEAQEGVIRVTKIVRGLKTFSRIEEERAAVIDLVPVIELSINMAFNEIRHRARLVKEYGRLPFVEADDARLGQVFINLLVNAAQALPENSSAENEIRIVTCTDERGWAVVEIRDTGPGIPQAILDRVFDPFFTTKPIGIGTGLGLAISHNIVTGMRGEISVRSELGRGTAFRVTLPPSHDLVPSSEAASAPAGASLTRAARVLVVDDEPALGLAVRRVLRGHDVTVVGSGQAALDLVGGGTDFDVVLSDLMMPGISGMELYRTLVRVQPKMASRIVFLTGGAFTVEANAFLDGVANERIEKPFDAEQLRLMIQKFVK